jgi:hypothetical protein
MARVSTWCVWVAVVMLLASALEGRAHAQEFDVAEIELPRPSFPLARVRFGRSIAIEGNVVVVGFGGRVADDRGGGFVVYELVGSVPIERGVFYWPDDSAVRLGDDGTGIESFGTELALQGRSLVVTSPSEYDHHGAVYLYRRPTPTSTTFTYVQRKDVPDASGRPLFGFSVALVTDGGAQHAIFGAPFWCRNPGDPCRTMTGSLTFGRLWGFTRLASSWGDVTFDQPSPATFPSGYFGWDVAADGDLVAVTEPGGVDNVGEVVVFRRSGTTLTRETTLVGSGLLGSGCGRGLALEGERVAIGCPFNDTFADDAGTITVFAGSGGRWDYSQFVRPADDAGAVHFGEPVFSHGILFATDEAIDRRGRLWAFDGMTERLRWDPALADDELRGLTADRTVVGHVIGVGAPGASSDAGRAWIYRVGVADGVSCSRSADCMSGSCNAGVCGRAPAGAPCDWTVRCEASAVCSLGTCMGLPIDAGMPDAAMPDAGVPLDAFVVPDAAMDPDAYVPPGVDASFPDAAAPDAASGEDAGQPVDAAGADGGAADVGSRDAGAVGAARARIPFTCTCRASSRGGAPLALLASSSIATLLWQRRRRVRR